MTEPKYFDITEDMITAVERGSATVRIIGGSFDGQDGRAQGGYVKADLLDVAVAPRRDARVSNRCRKKCICVSLRGKRALRGWQAAYPEKPRPCSATGINSPCTPVPTESVSPILPGNRSKNRSHGAAPS